MLMKKQLLNHKGCLECDSKVRGGNLTKAVDFSAFEKFDFTYKENISIILEDYWGENRNQTGTGYSQVILKYLLLSTRMHTEIVNKLLRVQQDFTYMYTLG